RRPEAAGGGAPARGRRGRATMGAPPRGRAEPGWSQVVDNPRPPPKQAPTLLATVLAAVLPWWVPARPWAHVAPAVAACGEVLVAAAGAMCVDGRSGTHQVRIAAITVAMTVGACLRSGLGLSKT
ncbi:hypothetical protein QRY11_08935, partial [Campylobacter jejuni]|uniref:hypothetical protein n=1 Tax=Campylobacter jejuni TaxID=197 RepID=UPI002B225546